MDYSRKIGGIPINLKFLGGHRKNGRYVQRGVDRLWIKEHGCSALIELLITQDEFPATTETYSVSLSVNAEIDRTVAIGTVEERFTVKRVDDGRTCPAMLMSKMNEHLERIVRAIRLYGENKDLLFDKEEGSDLMWVKTLPDEKKLFYEIEDMLEKYDFDVYYKVITKMAKELKRLKKEMAAEATDEVSAFDQKS